MAKSDGVVKGEVLPGGPAGAKEQLKIENVSGQLQVVTLLDWTNPGMESYRYEVEGMVRYEKVKAKSYLEMRSRFANGSEHFSRTLGESGPMQYLTGSSGWRRFTLPFSSDKANGYPVCIVVNVVLPDDGTVYLSPIRLVQYPDGWWTDRAGGWIGGIGGGLVGVLGGTIGVLAGFGKARRFVLGLTAILASSGVIGLIGGVTAFALGQPYAVYYPLLLIGAILAMVCSFNLPVLRRRYQQRELQKRAAMDAGVCG
jgi:hypothetical protein